MPDRQLLLILKSWFNDVIYFYLIQYAYQFFTCQNTEHRFHIPVHAVNRVPVHKTSIAFRFKPSLKLKLLFLGHMYWLAREGAQRQSVGKE